MHKFTQKFEIASFLASFFLIFFLIRRLFPQIWDMLAFFNNNLLIFNTKKMSTVYFTRIMRKIVLAFSPVISIQYTPDAQADKSRNNS